MNYGQFGDTEVAWGWLTGHPRVFSRALSAYEGRGWGSGKGKWGDRGLHDHLKVIYLVFLQDSFYKEWGGSGQPTVHSSPGQPPAWYTKDAWRGRKIMIGGNKVSEHCNGHFYGVILYKHQVLKVKAKLILISFSVSHRHLLHSHSSEWWQMLGRIWLLGLIALKR